MPGQQLLGVRPIEPVWVSPHDYETSNPLKPNWYKPNAGGLRIPTKAPCCNEMMPPPVTE
jgi:hypothetical protein